MHQLTIGELSTCRAKIMAMRARLLGSFLLLPLHLMISSSAWGAAPLVPPTVLVDVDHRPQQSLNGAWHTIVDPYRAGFDSWLDVQSLPNEHGYIRDAEPVPGGPLQEYGFAKSPTLNVPGDWNTQSDRLFFYEGTVWYERRFAFQAKAHTRTFLHVGAANYRANVAVNGTNICEHQGGFTSFDCDVTAALKDGDNSVVIGVDNERKRERVPTLKTDWWNYGGLTGEVSLVSVPESFIDDYGLALRKASQDQLVDLPVENRGRQAKSEFGASRHAARIEGYVHLVHASAGDQVTVRIPELKVEKTVTVDANGRAPLLLEAQGLERWSPEHPKLYKVEFSSGDDKLTDEIGFRTIEVQGDRILLNGKRIFLRGVSLHAEAPRAAAEGKPATTGRAWSDADAKLLLGWAKEMDGNFVRFAHYPYPETMTREADRLGLLVWSEIPVYWSIDWSSEAALASARSQLTEMIRRDRNKASVVFWSMSNETPRGEARTAFIRKLADQARADDPTRLITSAFVTSFHGNEASLDDPLGQYLDVLGYNEYLGWYAGPPDQIAAHTFTNPLGKPVIMSEFGAGAKAGLHEAATYRFSEEYQAEVMRQQFVMFAKIPFLRGLAPWCLMDFRSPTRQLPGIQDDYNRKGVISSEGTRKEAFGVLQGEYRKMAQ